MKIPPTALLVTLTLLATGCSRSPSMSNSTAPDEDCSTAKNTCANYSPFWHTDKCPEGKRCITFENACFQPVALAYQIGCDGDGSPGAPQCDCTDGPVLGATGAQVFWEILDGDYTSCLPNWKPACLTAGLAIIANLTTASCASGTRVELTAGNLANDYNHFDSYNLAVGPPAGQFYSIPVSFEPDIQCAVDHANHDCRPLWCDKKDCPDAYATPTTGGCPDGRSPQASCQDTFGPPNSGYTVTFCPTSGKSCQDAKACP